MSARLRFAPSPTGNLHIGGARTALFNWLQARHDGGSFLLRIEDTDLERSTEASVNAILEALAWLGIDHDEDVLFQTSRREAHLEAAHRLLDEGKAYRCYATPEELEQARQEATAAGRHFQYDRRWRDRTDAPSPDAPYVIRFRMPLDGEQTLDDLVLGPVTVENRELDDLVLVRSDGNPTFNLVVVCDDAHMGVTQVIRGQDHLRNTFRQLHIFRALGYELPQFGHLPLVDGLSKRKGSASVQHYRDAGFLREAVINYMMRLGWSHGDQEIFTVDELIRLFDVRNVNRASASYDETKMRWVNQEWIRRLASDDLAARLMPFLQALDIDAAGDVRLPALVDLLRERSETLVEMAAGARFVFQAPTEYDGDAVSKWFKAAVRPAFEALIAELDGLTSFAIEDVDAAIQRALDAHGLKFVKLGQPLRIALTGGTSSPSIGACVALTGQRETIARMRRALTLFDGAS